MLAKLSAGLSFIMPFIHANGEQVLDSLLEVIKNLLKPIVVFLIAVSRILYPPLIIIGAILWVFRENWLAWRFLSSGIMTAILVEIVLPALGLP